jgi:carboxylate-amine ligase
VIDRIRPWLPALLALSANSPFCQDADTRYHSYRSQMVLRWPTAGSTELFGSPAAYERTVRDLVVSGAAMDPAMIYFDARLSQKYPTVEVRVADVCLRAEDTVLVAALARALVETAAREATDGVEPAPWRTDLLRGASWRAGRHGLAGQLVHPVTRRLAPARAVVGALIEHVETALRDAGDLAAAAGQAGTVLTRGSGAVRQREVYSRTGDLAQVVADAVAITNS